MRLYQNQIYQKEDRTLRIVQLERLSVEYKEVINGDDDKAKHIVVTKKEFCRLIKGAELLASAT